MPLPNFPMFSSDDDQFQLAERYRHYLTRFRSELEGQERGIPNLVEAGQIWGVFPPGTGNLIIDPSFELNRDAWSLPLGTRILESVTARSGNYVLRMVSTEGYAAGFLVANAGAYTSCITGQALGLVGYVRGAVAATGTASATIQFYDAAKVVLSTVTGIGVALSTSWQAALVKAIVPAGAVYARFGFTITSLSGVADWDDALAVTVQDQSEVTQSAAVVNFSSTTETIIATVTMGPLSQVPIGGTASLLTPVTILGNCAYTAGAGAGGSVTFRIRRTNAAGAVLTTFPNLLGTTSLCIMAFDTAPDVIAQTWVLTAQMADATGGATAEHRLWASQHYL